MEPLGTRGRTRAAVVFTVVLAAGAALIAYKVSAQVRIGPGWDTYAFLANAAEFAGKGYGYTELHRPPFLSLLTAALFAAGMPLRESVIQWVDGAMSLSGLVAFYLICRRRFEPLLAGVGTLMLLAVQPLWQYVGSGYTDLPSVSLSLWLLLACMKATEERPAWYLAAGVLFTASVMTRYTAILAAFPVAIWVTLRWRPFSHARRLAGAVALSIGVYVPAALFYGQRFGDVLFPFIAAFGMSENISAPSGEGSATAAGTWYLGKMPEFLGGEPALLGAYLVLLVAGLGLTLSLVGYLQRHRPRGVRVLVALVACAPAIAAQVAGGMVLRQVTIPLAVSALWRAFAPYEETRVGRRVVATAALTAAMTAWLLAYADFHGHQPIQVPRYVITVAPPLVYLILLGWDGFVTDIRRTLGARDIAAPESRAVVTRYVAPAALVLFLAIAMTTTLAATAAERPDPYVIAAQETSAWLNRQPGIDDAMVISKLWPITAWYSRIPVKAMPAFDDATAYQHALDKHRADFYVALQRTGFRGYTLAMTTADACVLKRTSDARDRLPEVPYLGKAWDNYLESVTGYSFYLTGDQGPQEWGEMVFLDAMSAGELAPYDAVAVYGVRWRDRATGEAALLEYVRNGGSVVIDASGNLGTFPYDLADTVMFDTVIRRESLPRDARIVVGPVLTERDARLATIEAAPFVNESGGDWYGADYAPLPGSPDLDVLATVGGRPAVALRRIGAGRVYWIGYNLIWHAYVTESEDERALIGAVFAEALDREGTATRQ